MSPARSSARPVIVGPANENRKGTRVAVRGEHEISVPEADLDFLRVNHQRLQFGATEVVIESRFRLTVKGLAPDLDPSDRVLLGPALALYPGTLLHAFASPCGTLTLDFGSEARIDVPADQTYEAWQMNGPGSRMVVCEPGGTNLSVWE